MYKTAVLLNVYGVRKQMMAFLINFETELILMYIFFIKVSTVYLIEKIRLYYTVMSIVSCTYKKHIQKCMIPNFLSHKYSYSEKKVAPI